MTTERKLFFGVAQQGDCFYNGIAVSRLAANGIHLPREGGVYEVTKREMELEDEDTGEVRVQREYYLTGYGHKTGNEEADSPVILPTIQEPYEIKRAGCYIVFGDADSGKSFLVKQLCRHLGGKRLSITEPDGTGFPGTAFGYSAALKHIYDHAHSQDRAPFYAIDSLLAASVFGEALAAGGVAKSVFLLANTVDHVARLCNTIIFAVLNPLSDMANTSAYRVIEMSAKATTQGVIFTSGVQVSKAEGLARLTMNASIRPERENTPLPTVVLPLPDERADDSDINLTIPLSIQLS